MMESPNWLDMPHELMVCILERLSTVDKLRSARNVCRTWRRIVKDPAMWKVIDISRWQNGYRTYCYVEMLTKQTVDLSRGELTDFSINGYCTDHLLNYIVKRSGKLKHLTLCFCEAITGRALTREVKRLPQLEKLDLNNISINNGDTEAIGRDCPQLKSFTANFWFMCQVVECDDHAVSIAKSMPNLRHLELFGSEMTNGGLQAILNGCPHLEFLHIRMSGSFNLDQNLVNKCMERIKDFKHNSTQN